MTTNAFRTLIRIEEVRKLKDPSRVAITRETKREAVVRFDGSEGSREHFRLSKRNKSELSALELTRKLINGELYFYD